MHACNMLGHPQHPLGDATALTVKDCNKCDPRRLGNSSSGALPRWKKTHVRTGFSPSNTPPLCGVTLHFLHNRVYGINVSIQ